MRRCHGDGVQRQRPACRCLRVVPLTHERCLAPLGYLTHLPWGQSNGHPALRFESAVHGARSAPSGAVAQILARSGSLSVQDDRGLATKPTYAAAMGLLGLIYAPRLGNCRTAARRLMHFGAVPDDTARGWPGVLVEAPAHARCWPAVPGSPLRWAEPPRWRTHS